LNLQQNNKEASIEAIVMTCMAPALVDIPAQQQVKKGQVTAPSRARRVSIIV